MDVRICIASILLTTAACGGCRGPGGDEATAAPSGDASILTRMRDMNHGEIDAGMSALTKGSNPRVKSFAHDMIRDHRTMDVKDSTLATSDGLAPQAFPVPPARLESQQLNRVDTGAIFDVLYIDAQVIDQRTVLAELRQFQRTAQNAQLRSAISGAIPIVQAHLNRAKALQTVLDRPSTQS
jgi:putative membrane protein